MLNTADKEFIVDTIKVSGNEIKEFVIEYVSNEINDLASITAQGFKRVDERFEKIESLVY